MFDIKWRKVDIKRMLAKKKNLKKEMDRAMKDAAKDLLFRIIDKTSKSYNADGKRFKRYSESYREWRKKNGLSTTVNLRKTESMMRSLKVLKAPGGYKITPTFASGGISNIEKLRYVQQNKNYVIMSWSDVYKERVKKRIAATIRSVYS